jgi:hypothetical protein
MCCGHAGEHGQLNQPGCNVHTTGAVAMLLAPTADATSVDSLETRLSATLGESSAAALVRRVSRSVLHVRDAPHAAENDVSGAAAKLDRDRPDSPSVIPERREDVRQWADAESGGTPADPADEVAGSVGADVPEQRAASADSGTGGAFDAVAAREADGAGAEVQASVGATEGHQNMGSFGEKLGVQRVGAASAPSRASSQDSDATVHSDL